MIIQIAGADFRLCCNVIGCDRFQIGLIEEADGGFNDFFFRRHWIDQLVSLAQQAYENTL